MAGERWEAVAVIAMQRTLEGSMREGEENCIK